MGDGERIVCPPFWAYRDSSEPSVVGEELALEFDLSGRAKPILCGGFVVWTSKAQQHEAGGRTGVALRLTNQGIADRRAIAAGVGRSLEAEGR